MVGTFSATCTANSYLCSFLFLFKDYGRNILRCLHCNKLSLFIPSVVDLKEITKNQVSILIIRFA